MEISMESPQKIKNKTIIWFNSFTPEYLYKEKKKH